MNGAEDPTTLRPDELAAPLVPQEAPAVAPSAPAIEAPPAAAAGGRYAVAAEGEMRAIVCDTAPNIRVRVVRGLTVTDDERKKYPKQTIFLDGVLTGPPFLNNELRHYSFDHHAGGVPRQFLLASCEQAAVMIHQGLPLDEGAWQVLINEPDLDAALAAWLLVNHALLKPNNGQLLGEIMPLVRVEGVIDAHGIEAAAISGLPVRMWDHYFRELEDIGRVERNLKESGRWGDTDLLEYTRELFDRLDARLLPAAELQAMQETKEIGRVDLAGGQLVIACRSRQNIYAVEERLKERFGKKLAVILLDAGSGQYTLRQVDSFLPRNLNDLYAELNEQDAKVNKNNQWGGSGDIGGSPRQTGSGLSTEQILVIMRGVFGPKRAWWRRLFGRA